MTCAAWLTSAFLAFAPTPEVRTLEFAMERMTNEFGRPYDHWSYPHLGAPGGPMDARDCPWVRTESLQFATRLGKTFLGQVFSICAAVHDPGPQLLATPMEDLTRQIMQREYEILDHRPQLAALLRHKSDKMRKMIHIRYRNGAQVFGAWARSVKTLADKTAKYGHAAELDKWEHQTTSREAHPLKLFDDRFKDVLSVSFRLYESTPTIKGRSSIERLLNAGWNCRFFVPCPHCKRYQKLAIGGEETTFGIKWDRRPDGKSDPELARRSARYCCEHCWKPIDSTRRQWMMRRGVWCPEGCDVVGIEALRITEEFITSGKPSWVFDGWRSASWVSGAAVNDGPNASHQLSSLYALSLDWGDIAAEFLRVKDVPSFLRNFVNQWKGETWEIAKRSETWETLATRLTCETPRGLVPSWATTVAIGVDRQEDVLPWVAVALDSTRRVHVLDYGLVETPDEIEGLLNHQWQREIGGTVEARFVLPDTGYKASEIYQLAKKHKRVLPARGSSTALAGYYQRKQLGKKSSHPGVKVVWIDGDTTQDWVDRALFVVERGQPNSLSLFAGNAPDHEAICCQLLNEQMTYATDSSNHSKGRWERIDEHTPNDYRDALRYAFVGGLIGLKSQPLRTFKAKEKANETSGTVPSVQSGEIKRVKLS